MKSLSKMHPFQLILLIVFGLAALGGLYLFATYNGIAGTGPKIGAVTIWGTLPSGVVQQELATITSANKEYGKITYVQKQADSFNSQLSDAIASGNGPDLILIAHEHLLTEENKIDLIPYSTLPERTFLSNYLPEFQLFLTSDGTYGIPYVLDPLVLYYNRGVLTSNGLANPPSSWEAVTGLAQSISKVNSDGSLAQSTIALGSYDNIEDARAILSLLFLQSGSSISQATTGGVRSTLGATPSDGSSLPAAQSALSFYTQFADAARTVYSWNGGQSSARQSFVAGDSALYVGFASEVALLKASNPNLDFDMAPIPQPQTASQRVDYGVAYAFAIPKATHNYAGAYAAALALSGRNEQTAAIALSMAPANRSQLNYSATDIYAPVFYPQALIAQGWLSPAPAATDTIFAPMISSINSGQRTVSDALARADQALTAALQQ